MQRFFIFAFMAVLLSACGESSRNIGSYPTFISTLTASQTLTQSTTSPIASAEASLISPSPTSVTSSLILADFPLSVGTVWKYTGDITYQNPNDHNQTTTWSGIITDLVIEQKTISDGKIIFTLQESLDPTPPQDVWRQSGTFEYIVSGNGIIKNDWKIYQWPLSNNLTWAAQADSGYDVIINYIGEVDTPYGKLKGCYTLLLATLPDTTKDTFCPGIGFAEHTYQHNGDRQDEHFVLKAYEPVK